MRQTNDITSHTVQIVDRQWLTDHTFELRLSRPTECDFQPGQKIAFLREDMRRDYSLISAPDDGELIICVRLIKKGRFSGRLAKARPGDVFQIIQPFGFFTFKSSPRTAVFVATGTGVAPFVAFVRSGVQDFALLHGVRTPAELYYARELSVAARIYVPCISGLQGADPVVGEAFAGRVTDYLQERFPLGQYDFYLCGRAEMIRDMTDIIDQRFPGSLLFTEAFF